MCVGFFARLLSFENLERNGSRLRRNVGPLFGVKIDQLYGRDGVGTHILRNERVVKLHISRHSFRCDAHIVRHLGRIIVKIFGECHIGCLNEFQISRSCDCKPECTDIIRARLRRNQLRGELKLPHPT